MKDKKALIVSQEIAPYIKISDIATFFERIPPYIKSLGTDLRIFMPCYGIINERKNQLHEVIRLSRMNLNVADIEQPLIIKVASIPNVKVQVYFIYNEDLFARKSINCDEKGTFFKDNDERAMFFCTGVLETVKKLSWVPDFVHVHGWMSSLIPMMMKSYYKDEPIYENTKIILSVYDDYFKGILGPEVLRILKKKRASKKLQEKVAKLSHEMLLEISIRYSDAITIGSKKIAPQLLNAIYKSKKQVLPYRDEDRDPKRFSDFYMEILDNE